MRVYLLLCGVVCILLPNAVECIYSKERARFQQGDRPIPTYRTVEEDGKRAVCGNRAAQISVLKQSNKLNALGLAGEMLANQWVRPSYTGDEKPQSNIEYNDDARIDLQGFFSRYGKRWANLQIQRNGLRPKGESSSFAHLFLETGKEFPIEMIRDAFKQSMLRCAKVWLEFPPQSVPGDLPLAVRRPIVPPRRTGK